MAGLDRHRQRDGMGWDGMGWEESDENAEA
jgi:hypothetical protein